MNHVKKLLLVSPESVAKLNDATPSTAQTQTSSLDAEMDLILRKKYADDSEKWKHYNEALQRYLYFVNEKKRPVEISVADYTESKDTSELIRNQLETALPKTYKAAALRIFDYLKQSATQVTWDSQGIVSIDNQPIPNSNIIDLISDLTRQRKSFEPTGVSRFIKALSTANIPLELVSNSTRRQEISDARNQSGSGLTIISPPPVTHPKQIRKGRVAKRVPPKKKGKVTKRVSQKRNAWKTW